ncbi:MAG: 50S ribosomal protein L25 [Candidatus Methylomirabilales bacterium]
MATVDLQGEIRTGLGKGVAKKLRRAKRIPGIVYGGGQGALPVTVDPAALQSILGQGENVLINLSLAGDGARSAMVILKELQRDPVKGRPLHVDFQEVSMEKKIRVEVSLHLTGEATGVKNKGGILEHGLRQLFVECLPLAIPERITVDVSGLDIGNSIHVADLTLPEGVRVLDDPERVVASVVAPTVEEAPAPAEAEVAEAEPEVVGKKEKEEAAAEEGKGKAEAKGKAEPKAEAKAK